MNKSIILDYNRTPVLSEDIKKDPMHLEKRKK